MDAESLYDTIADLDTESHEEEHGRALLALAAEQWPALSSRKANAFDAETCRLVMLAAAKHDEFEALRLWRARALSRFTAVGWVEGVASILMSEAFTELSRENDFYAAGRTLDVIVPSATALAMLEEIERFTEGPGSGIELSRRSPSQASLRRLFHEKRGFLLLLAGDHQESRAAYERALAAAANERGKIKVRLGIELVDYSAALAAGGVLPSGDETRHLGGAASAAQSGDIAETATLNAGVMDSGGRALHPYEIL